MSRFRRAFFSSISFSNSSSKRLPSNQISLETSLFSTNPELVASHLCARRNGDDDNKTVEDVHLIGSLRLQRNTFIAEGDAARKTRKSLSLQIGQLVKSGIDIEENDIQVLKKQVERANIEAAIADEKKVKVDAQIHTLFSSLPNLLDDR